MVASSHKRPLSTVSNLIPNPFIKRRNLDWVLNSPTSTRQQTPQSESSSSAAPAAEPTEPTETPRPTTTITPTTTADIESGAVQITDHLAHFASHLSSHILPPSEDVKIPKLSILDYTSLYESCAGNTNGAHFVIHQHDHPIAGTHYDLRLQINETSSASWAIMYGLPGDPNSIRLSRIATETRIHSLWNHLIKTTSPETSVYSILPRQSKHAPRQDPSSPHSPASSPSQTPQSLPHAAFQNRKIRIRLHGTKLPDPYILNLRLTKSEDATSRSKSPLTPRFKRRRGMGKAQVENPPETASSESDSDEESANNEETIAIPGEEPPGSSVSALDQEHRKLEDIQVRLTNAYPGASNTIDSIHQRKWYLALDRRTCGFIETKRNGRFIWELPPKGNVSNPTEDQGHHDLGVEDNLIRDSNTHRLSFPFYVHGPDHERSVVTGRRSKDILRDEGVMSFAPKKGWKPVLK
ncbi:hypothetical protein PT974_06259 [Cladobotryum mycophilum]|uniref:DNA ligase D 3'-phosphoesterase domain-containing protein n=1 Tax=Cladobotryum mycophilum TaxID=491253 RepID=A0ABR0SLR8_9HYPO